MRSKGGTLQPYIKYEFFVSTFYMNVEYSQKVIATILNYDVVPVVSIEWVFNSVLGRYVFILNQIILTSNLAHKKLS